MGEKKANNDKESRRGEGKGRGKSEVQETKRNGEKKGTVGGGQG